jgi:hypothetical protein
VISVGANSILIRIGKEILKNEVFTVNFEKIWYVLEDLKI